MLDQSKLAIATSGGGMTCVYSAGALLAIAERYNIKEPGRVVGSSGSTGSLAYYVAQQYSSGQRIWIDLLSTREFVDKRRIVRGNVLDLDYLVDRVFREIEPLDVEAIRKSKTNLIIATTDFETGEPSYFNNWREQDVFKVLKASKAAPVVYRGEVWINGRRYIDGDISSPLEKNIDVAINSGAELVIAIDNSNVLSRVNRLFLLRYVESTNPRLREAIESYIGAKTKRREDPRVIYITPTQPLPIGTLDNGREDLRKTMDLGYSDTVSNRRLQELLVA